MKLLRARNWASFQHYKDRSPAWIKLHKGLLDNYEFHCLPLASRALAPLLWLLVSEKNDGELEYRPERIAFRLRTTTKEIEDAVKPLISAGFFDLIELSEQPASDLLAECLPREERETEEETEEEKEKELCLAPDDLPADEPTEKTPDPVKVVFTYWQTRLNHSRSALDDKRRKRIREALRLKYSVAELCDAIDGCAATPFNMGENDRGEVYDSIDVIFRNADQIDRFIRNKSKPPRTQNKHDANLNSARQSIRDFAEGATHA